MSGAASRQQRRVSEKDGRAYYEARGLPPGGSTVPLAIHTRALIRILSNARNASRASAAAEASLRSFDRSARAHPAELALQCQRGCAFCCHDMVAATAPEVFRLADQVLAQPAPAREAALRRLQAAHAATADDDPAARLRRRRPCGMLESGACAGYAARPLACRAANSASARACEAAFHEPGASVPVAKVPVVLRDAHRLCLLAALHATGLDERAYELNHALWRAVSLPDGQARWLRGEAVFADVQSTPAAGTQQSALVQALLAEALR